MPVRKYQQYDDPTDYYYQEIESEQTPLYQEYLPEAETSPRLSELFFFLNIAVFCVLTVLFSFVFLSLKMNTFMSFTLAIASSLISIQSYRLFAKKRQPCDSTILKYKKNRRRFKSSVLFFILVNKED